LHPDRVAGRHMHCMQTRLQAGLWTAGRQARVSRKHAVWQAMRVAGSRHGSRTAIRQVGLPAHTFRADVAGRQADLQEDRVAGRYLRCR
jgi:hypothetical protein